MSAENQTYPASFQDLLAFTKEAMQRLHVPGVTIGLYTGGQTYTAGLGITSVDNPLPVTADTLLQIGSITKTYTSTAIFMLCEQGKLSLDDPVRKHLPDFRVVDEQTAAAVTIRHLLDHTSGWLGDHFLNTGNGDDCLAKYVETMASLEQFTPLGEVFTYNNAAFNLAGRVIEVITGKTYEAAIREMVIEPLALNDSTFFLEDIMTRRFAVGHRWEEEKQKVVVLSPWGMERNSNACGGLISTVGDQLRYARFHMGDTSITGGSTLLSAETLKTMQSPVVKSDETWMGLNWYIWDIEGVRILEHGGSTNGQQATLWFAPEKDFAFCMLTNEQTGYILHTEVTNLVRKQYLGIEEKEPITFTLPDEKLNGYVARYQASFGDIVSFTPQEGGLLMTHTPALHPGQETPDDPFPPTRTLAIDEDRFLFIDPPFKGWKFDFLRDGEGRVKYLRFSGRIWKLLKD